MTNKKFLFSDKLKQLDHAKIEYERALYSAELKLNNEVRSLIDILPEGHNLYVKDLFTHATKKRTHVATRKELNATIDVLERKLKEATDFQNYLEKLR